MGASLQTQFAPGYEDGNNPDAKKISNFFAPGYLNLGAGVTYRPNDNLTVTLRPANARWTFVLDKDLQTAGTYGLKNDGILHYSSSVSWEQLCINSRLWRILI
jgi:hypothetical protein